MTRLFSIPKMLRMTPNELLRDFFLSLDAELLCVDWKRLRPRQIGPLLNAIGWLSPEKQQQVESELAAIFELSGQSGWEVILDAAYPFGKTKEILALSEECCFYGRALLVWLHHREVFNKATLMEGVDNLTRLRKRSVPPLPPRINPDTIRELEKALACCLWREEGRGKHCTVDYFRRNDSDVLIAWLDDFVQAVISHDEQGKLGPRFVRPTFEVAFIYRQQEGTLELYAKVAPALKPKLEAIFAEVILRVELAELGGTMPYDLNQLKERYFLLPTDPEDHVAAWVRRLRLDLPDDVRVTVELRKDTQGCDIYSAVESCLGEQASNLEGMDISLATFRLEFLAHEGRKSGRMSLDVTYPDHCTIHSNKPERIDLARKYLRRWRIARA
jgi:hypothetical protein